MENADTVAGVKKLQKEVSFIYLKIGAEPESYQYGSFLPVLQDGEM